MIKLTIPQIVISFYRLRNIGASWCLMTRRKYFRLEIFGRVFSIQVM